MYISDWLLAELGDLLHVMCVRLPGIKFFDLYFPPVSGAWRIYVEENEGTLWGWYEGGFSRVGRRFISRGWVVADVLGLRPENLVSTSKERTTHACLLANGSPRQGGFLMEV